MLRVIFPAEKLDSRATSFTDSKVPTQLIKRTSRLRGTGNLPDQSVAS